MSAESRWRRYLRFFGTNAEADVDDELRFHLDERIAEYEGQGVARADAERLARERFGDVTAVARTLRRRSHRKLRWARLVERVSNGRQNARLAVRTLQRAPGWTASVVLTLALGIGLATAVYTIADALLIRPLPVRSPERIVVMWGSASDGRAGHFPFLYRDALEYERRTRTLDDVAFFSFGGAQPVPVDLDAGVAQLRRSSVSGNYFQFLGVAPLLGRTLHREDDVRGAALVAVLSFTAWHRFFGGDPGVIGRRFVLHFADAPYTIVGVMPRAFDYPQGTDFWTTVVPNAGPLGDQPIYAELNALGRLRRGASLAGVRAELTRFFALSVPSWRLKGEVHSFSDDVVGDVGPAVVAFGVAAALLLFITCMNVANLLLVRGLGRVRELAVRAALGAGRARLIAQLLMESALLAGAGGIVGIGLAVAAVKAFVAIAPAGTPRLAEIRVNAATVAAAIVVTTLSILVFAVVPSVNASRVDVQEALRSGTRQSGGSRRFRRGAQVLVGAQMAIAVLVLCVSGLVARSLLSLGRVPIALDPARLLVIELALPKRLMDEPAKAANEFVAQVAARVSSVPGVRAAAPVFTPPFAEVGGVFGRVASEGQTASDKARDPVVDYELATPSEFAAFGIPLIRGRAFNEADREGEPPVAIVSESMARQYWPTEDPIGKRLVLDSTDLATVVGVVGDTHYRDLRNPRPRLYLPLRQSPFPITPTTLIVSTAGEPSSLIATLRRVIGEAAPGAAVASAAPLETYVGDALAQPRMNALLLGVFAGAALLLAAIGLFGVMATSVRQRARELSLRLALGATPHQLRVSVMTRAMAIACAGAGVGIAASLAATRGLGALLFGVSPADPPTFAGVSLLLVSVALIAAYVPAARAERVDPAQALRGD